MGEVPHSIKGLFMACLISLVSMWCCEPGKVPPPALVKRRMDEAGSRWQNGWAGLPMDPLQWECRATICLRLHINSTMKNGQLGGQDFPGPIWEGCHPFSLGPDALLVLGLLGLVFKREGPSPPLLLSRSILQRRCIFMPI